MSTIHNPTTTTYHLPSINAPERDDEGRKVVAHPSPGMVRPGELLEVSPAYLKALGSHPSWAKRLEGKGSAKSIKHHTGTAGRFERQILAKREAKAEAAGKSTENRVEALENEVTAAKGAAPASDR